MVQFDEVPLVQSILTASAALIGVCQTRRLVFWLTITQRSVNPVTVLSTLQVNGSVELRVVARDLVGVSISVIESDALRKPKKQ